jgi:4-azaleucine resistance transporter AzlC
MTMTVPGNGRFVAPCWSRAGLAQGVRLSVPGIPGMAVFGVAFGAIAAQKGLTLFEATLMSALVFAGASQFVAVEMWTDPMTAAVVVKLGVVTATVNLRFVLMSAALQPWLGGLPAWQTYPALSLMTDPGWLIAACYRADGGMDPAVFLGSGFALWLVWIASTMPGHLLGTFVTEPKRFGLDLVMPCFFVVMLVPLWRGRRKAIPWLVAGVIALVAGELIPGWWFIITGAVAGSVTAGMLDGRA